MKKTSQLYSYLTNDYVRQTSLGPLTHRAALDVCSNCRALERRFDIEIEFLVGTPFDLQSTLEALSSGREGRNLRRAARLYHEFHNRAAPHVLRSFASRT